MTYDLANNTYSKIAQDNPKDLIAVEVGDSKQVDFYPQVKIQRWDNEVNFSARLVTDEKTPTVTTDVDKILWQGDKVEANFYELPEGYEFEVVLKEPPKTNVVEFTLETKGLDFFYQPELTQEEKDRGAERPENVVGSYVVYASENKVNYAGGKEYKVGKIGHIYRPKIIDSAGTEVWGELNITGAVLSVTIPQDFLDKAVYPVRHAAGLTFGYSSLGASQVAYQLIRGVYAATGAAGTLTKYTIYGYYTSASQPKAKVALYKSDNSLFTESISSEVTITDGSATLIDFTASATVTAVTYRLAIISDSNTTDPTLRLRYDTGQNNGFYHSGASYPTFPSTLSPTQQDVTPTIYATYTAAGGGVTGPAFMSNRALGRVGT